MERLTMTLDEIYKKTKDCLENGPIIIGNLKITSISHHKDLLFLTGVSYDKFGMEMGFFISDNHYHEKKEKLINYLLKLDNVWYD